MPPDRSRLPLATADRAFRFPAIATRRLANGLTIRAVERPGLPIVACLALVRAGSGADPPSLPGLASLTADLLDEGTTTRSAMEIAETLQTIGTALDTEVGADATLLGIRVLVRHAPLALALLGDMLMHPAFVPREVDRVREQRLTRLVQLRDVAGTVADQAFLRAVYGSHPYGHLAIGTEEALQSVTRESSAGFYQSHVRPDRSAIIVAGEMEATAASDEVERVFGNWSAEGPARPDSVEDPPEPATRRVLLADKPGASQSELRIGHLGIARRSPDFEALQVMNMALGGQFASRINMNLREDKGFTYGARTIVDARRGRGPFVVQVAVHAASTAAAITEIVRELAAVRADRPVDVDELSTAKGSIVRGFARNFETPEQIARATAQLTLHDLPDDHFDHYLRQVGDVTSDDVTRVAREYLHLDRLAVVTVGPASAVADALRSLGFGDPITTP